MKSRLHPTVIRAESVVLEIAGVVREIPGDFVWIFGGTLPNEFLRKSGIEACFRDLTAEAGRERLEPARMRASLGSVQ